MTHMPATGTPPQAAILPRRRVWLRIAHRAALVLTLAGLVHLGAVLLTPRYASQDAGTVFLTAAAEGHADLLRPGTAEHLSVSDLDPATAVAVCGFDLEDGPLRVSMRTGQLPLSVSVHLRGGGVQYAVTDRAAQRGVIEFVVVNRRQFEERVAADDDSDTQRELRVVSPAAQGVVAARVLVRQPSDRAAAEALAAGMACGAAN